MSHTFSLLKEKKALVTGGTSGIGREIALTFSREGASVAIFGLHEGRAKEVVEEMRRDVSFADQEFLYDLVDVSKKEEVDQATSLLLSRWSNVEILVNCAGVVRDALLARMDEEKWDQVIDTNLKSVYNTSRSLAKRMMQARRGKMINIVSVVGIRGNAGQANYAASKAGIVGFSKSLARELAPRNICVNCIAPGYIVTSMTETLTDSQRADICQSIPMKRLGEPKDVASLALFLASPFSDYLTGQVIAVDGGMLA